jgi:hypothetical protein
LKDLDTIYAILHRGFYVMKVHHLIGSFSAVLGGQEKGTVAGFFFASFAMVGSETREGN